MTNTTSKPKHFKPKAHILRLLGNELIKSPVMAIYELVKNSYDADSEQVTVNFLNITDPENASIIIEDNGTGLTSDIIENVWLEPGTDHRKPIGKDGKRVVHRSPIYSRVPMGEKGIGRFAAHKLGEQISLITRPAKIVKSSSGEMIKVPLDYEIILTINWDDFSQSKYLEDIPISWDTKTEPSEFLFKEKSGTRIIISSLKETWTKRMAKDLKRHTLSMLSPKNDEDKFKIALDFENQWLENFPEVKEILDIAPSKFTGLMDEDYNLTFDYTFCLTLDEEFGKRELKSQTVNIKESLLVKLKEELKENEVLPDEVEQKIRHFSEQKCPFGNLMLDIYTYDLDSETLKNYTHEARVVKDVLKFHSGIQVFKDDMRVFDYGSPKNDWLELDIKRVNQKSWMSNNQNIGYIYLDSESSVSLIETTNREGFIEDVTYKIFYQCVLSIMNEYKNERWKDRTKWLAHINPPSNAYLYGDRANIFKELITASDLTQNEQKEKLIHEAENLQKDFEQKKETLLIPAGVGMTASVALHEIEKLLPRMKSVVKNKPFKREVANEIVSELEDNLNGILSVLRKGGNKPIQLHDAIEKAILNYRSRLNSRKINVETNFDESIETIKCDRRFFITMVMNLIENSMYWLDTIFKENKAIYVQAIKGKNNSVSVVIVDNGPGFKDEISDIVMPFFSRKEDGIGIGMYLIDTIMMKYGKVEIISKEEAKELGVPEKYDGAAVRLVFNKGQGNA